MPKFLFQVWVEFVVPYKSHHLIVNGETYSYLIAYSLRTIFTDYCLGRNTDCSDIYIAQPSFTYFLPKVVKRPAKSTTGNIFLFLLLLYSTQWQNLNETWCNSSCNSDLNSDKLSQKLYCTWVTKTLEIKIHFLKEKWIPGVFFQLLMSWYIEKKWLNLGQKTFLSEASWKDLN